MVSFVPVDDADASKAGPKSDQPKKFSFVPVKDGPPASERLSAAQWVGKQGEKVAGGFVKDLESPAKNAWEDLKADFQKATDVEKPKSFWDAQKKEFDRFVAAGKTIPDAFKLAVSPITGAINAVAGRPVAEVMNTLAAPAISHGAQKMSPGEASDILMMGAPVKGSSTAGATNKAAEAVRPGFSEARAAGYVVPPAEASEKPGGVANALAAWGGKIKTQQAASVKNQAVTNGIAAKELGLGPDASLDEAAFKKYRQEQGKAYQAVRDAFPDRPEFVQKYDDQGLPYKVWQGPQKLEMGKDFNARVDAIADDVTRIAKDVPALGKQRVEDLIAKAKQTNDLTLDQVIEATRQYRTDATNNLKGPPDPEKNALGLVQKKLADALEDMTEQRLTEMGKPDLVSKWRKARVQIAKSHDIEEATDAAGNVDARKIAAMADKGRPFTGGLKTIADTAEIFPKDMQNPSRFGGAEAHSVVDLGTAALSGRPEVLGAILARPLARSAVLSETIQNRLAGLSQPSNFGSNVRNLNALAQIGQNRGPPFIPPPNNGQPVGASNALSLPLTPPPQPPSQ